MDNSRNILFITADQWRGDCLSLARHPVVKTPHLDQLASEAVVFRNHFTNAVPCGPSRACLHTGLYLHNHRSGRNGTPLDTRFTNWALELRAAGYDPALLGYTHTAMDPRGVPVDHPGLRNDEGILPGINPIVDMATLCTPWRDFLQEKGYEVPENHGATYGARKSDEAVQNIPAPSLYSREHTDTCFLVDRTIEHIKEKNESNPPNQGWCIHLSLRAPHPPWVAAEPYNSMYALDELPAPVRHATPEEQRSTHPWLEQHLLSDRNQSHTSSYRHKLLQASYYGLMSEVDEHMGRLIGHLKETNQLDNTLVIFTSDHGEQMGDHWLYGKESFYDQSFHIPLIIRAPGKQPGSIAAFTEHVDIMPTILSWLDLDVPRQCDGYSLMPLIEGNQPSDWRQSVHFEYDYRNTSTQATLGTNMEAACMNIYRDNEYKYIHFADMQPLLFDLRKDPAELYNIAEENPLIAGEYAQKLLSWRMQYTDKTLSHILLSRESGLTAS